MKTKLIITATLILATSFLASAGAPKKFMTFYDQMGRMFNMPVKVEEEAEIFHFDSKTEFNRHRANEVSRTFDLGSMTKPEAEIDDIPFELQSIIMRTTK